MEAISSKCTNNQVQPHANKSSVFGNFELEQFLVSPELSQFYWHANFEKQA